MTVSNGNGAKPQSIRAPNPQLEDSVFKMFKMTGKTVIITGGSGGIGYEIARGLAEAGANVCSPHLLLTAHILKLALDSTLVPYLQECKRSG
jgi:predicted Rossmann-fold nucleotide-binding protein